MAGEGIRNYNRGKYAEDILLAFLLQHGAYAYRVHKSRGPFDVIATTSTETILAQVKRRKDKIVSVQAIENAFRKDVDELKAVPRERQTRILIYLYTDPPKGQRAGTWRAFEVLPAGLQEIPPPYIPADRSGYRGAV